MKSVCMLLSLLVAAVVSAKPSALGKCAGKACTGSVLSDGEELSSWSAAYNNLFDLDFAADDAWRAVGSVEAFDAKREALRKVMIGLIGGFPPARTPLNARVTGMARCAGCRIESVIFESRPGAYVTGNMYLPEDGRFAAPYPAAIEVCGHSPLGKNATKYQHVAMLAAKCGVATFVVDPLCQGERSQCEEDMDGRTTAAHLRLGVNAMLLGHGLAAFELWDAMRALDYLDTRQDLRHDGYGAMGNSGGGTQSVMLSALDPRIKATATSSFLSNLREQTAWRLLADSEQLIFAQLRDGLNHAGYALLGGNPVLMLARRDEIIPFTGTRETYRVLTRVSERIGREGWYSMYDLPGPHGYCERNMRASVKFLVEHLRGETADFSGLDGDVVLDPGRCLVTKTGRVLDEAGFKSAYAYLQEELDVALASRKEMAAGELSALVRRLADIDERRLGSRKVLSCEETDGMKIMRVAFDADGGYRVPAVEMIPSDVKGAPALVVGDGLRSSRMSAARRFIAEGRPVMLADVFATGEIGKTRHHYSNPNDDEEVAKMLYLVGSSLVGRRAGEIIALVEDMKRRYGAPVTVVAHGRTAVAVAHAFAVDREAFGDPELVDAPLPWAESVRTRAFYDYASAVHGALLHYDWRDLVPDAKFAHGGESIQARIDAAFAGGGGVVRIGPGMHRSAALVLKSGVTLRLDKGAVLQAETNSASYAATDGHAFILADGADRVAIEGDGVIDGGGSLFPPASLDVMQQPRLVWFRDCRNVRVEGVTLRNGRRWTCYFDRCDGVVARDVKIRSLQQRCCDGFDIESKNTLVERCDIETQDDSIVFKARSSDYTVENVTVRNCRIASNCNLIKVGTETLGTIRNITVEDIVCGRASSSFAPDRREWKEFVGSGIPYGPFAYSGIALGMLDGGRLENVTVRRIALNDTALVPVFIRLARRTKRILPGQSTLRNVVIEDVSGTALSAIGCSITGLEDLRPSNITLRNVSLTMKNGDVQPVDPLPELPQRGLYVGMWLGALPVYGFYLRHADDVTFDNVVVSESVPGRREPFRADDCKRFRKR